MNSIKRIRKIMVKSRIRTIKNYIKWAAERGEERMEINFKDPHYKNDLCKCTDVHVLDYLKSKGFKIKQDENSFVVSWEE